MNFRLNIKRFLIVIPILFIIYFSPCCASGVLLTKETPVVYEPLQDPLVGVYCKTIYRITLIFDDLQTSHSYEILTRKDGYPLVLRADGVVYSRAEIKRSGLTSLKFKQTYGHDDIFHKLMDGIDSSFFELSNKDKITALEKVCVDEPIINRSNSPSK